MTKRCTFLLAIVGVFSASIAMAQEIPPRMTAPGAGALPAHEIGTIVRSTGFQPTGRPVLRGRHYEVQAIDPYQLAVRLVINARTGQIIAVRHDVNSGPPGAYGEAYAQASPHRPVPPWRTRLWREGRPVPPRAIPSGSTALAAQKAPLPRPRPDDQTGSIGGAAGSAGAPARAAAPPSSPAATGGGVNVPVAPLE